MKGQPHPAGSRAGPPRAQWLSVTAYADVYGVTRATVYKWLRAHVLQTYALGRILRIRNLPPDQHHPDCL